MEAISARNREIAKEDRISNLPDDVLHAILSLINIQLAVQTCVLSKRWTHLWKSLPNLSFDFGEFQVSCCKNLPNGKDCKAKRPTFVNFVNFVQQMLSHRKSLIVREFGLSVSGFPVKLVNQCCVYAMEKQVKRLYIGVNSKPIYSFELVLFPPLPLSAQYLTRLELECGVGCILLRKSFCFPAVATLCLGRYAFYENNNPIYVHSPRVYDQHNGDDDDRVCFAREIFSIFPKLENLTLKDCMFLELDFASDGLRSLELIFSEVSDMVVFSAVKRVVLSTPSLVSFRFEGYNSLSFDKEMDYVFPCLDYVYIDMWPKLPAELECYGGLIECKFPTNLINMLEKLPNAKFVTLTSNTVKVLEMDPGALEGHPPPFCNLKHLKVVAVEPMDNMAAIFPFCAKAYLTHGLGCDVTVVEFPQSGSKQLKLAPVHQ